MGETFEGMKEGMRIFGDAAKILGSENVRKSKQSGLSVDPSIIPAIVLYGFSCELALKALLEERKVSVKKTHKLDILFNKLPESDQNIISQKVIAKMSEETTNGYDGNFATDLKNIGGAFEEWRYYYESGRQLELIFLLKFSVALEEYVNSLNNDSDDSTKQNE